MKTGAGMSCLVLLLCSITQAWAQEKKIERKDLPPAVEKTAATESVQAEIRGFSVEKKEGKTYYEMQLAVTCALWTSEPLLTS